MVFPSPFLLILVLMSVSSLSRTFKHLEFHLEKSAAKIYSYNSGSPLPILSSFDGDILSTSCNRSTYASVHVLCGSRQNLLSFQTSYLLGLLSVASLTDSSSSIIHAYKDRFNSMVNITDIQVKLEIIHNVQPVAQGVIQCYSTHQKYS